MNANVNIPVESRKSKVLAIILCIIGFFGFGGLHRLYTGKYISGIIWLFTYGLFGIGTVVDLILLLTGKFYDKDDKPLLR
ncbi:MAG: TM2 domain-containing protein [Ruminococcus sp.]|nr:TM2 domain-containing protein [Ruminococcus sp.]